MRLQRERDLLLLTQEGGALRVERSLANASVQIDGEVGQQAARFESSIRRFFDWRSCPKGSDVFGCCLR
ncbi:MAG: hypothetical protein M3O46_13250, partial [Myxococcota bacterium]|nr:hypothetical protein [Myxococcota bacterium]